MFLEKKRNRTRSKNFIKIETWIIQLNRASIRVENNSVTKIGWGEGNGKTPSRKNYLKLNYLQIFAFGKNTNGIRSKDFNFWKKNRTE